MITDQNGRKLSELVEKTEENQEILKKIHSEIQQSNLLSGNSVQLLSEIQEGHNGKFFVWLKKHKWTTISSVFFGLVSVIFSATQVSLVLAGLYYYPNETRALIQTVLTMLGVQ